VKISDFIKSHERTVGNKSGFINTAKIVDSPGFVVNMAIKSYDDIFICETEMDNISINVYMEYIDVIQMYVDSLLRITQDSGSTGVSNNVIMRICKDTTGKPSVVEKFDNIVTGIEAAAISDIMYSDIYEDEDVEPVEEIDRDIEVESTAFGDLKQYESVDIKDDVEDINDYENIEDFELLMPIQPAEIESLSPIPESEDKSEKSLESLSQIPKSEDKSEKSLESLSPIPSESEKSEKSLESLSTIPESEDKSEKSLESLSQIPESEDKSEKSILSTISNMMFAPEEKSESSNSNSSQNMMFAPE